MERDRLLGSEEAKWGAFEAQVSRVPEEERRKQGVVPGWSVLDLVWHCGWWADWCAARLEAIASGTFVREDHPDEYWDAMNERIAQESKTLEPSQIEAGVVAARHRVRAALEALGDVSDEAAQVFAEETFLHYDEHLEHLRAFVDRLGGQTAPRSETATR